MHVPTAEIHYIIPEISKNQSEFEEILAAMGQYQDEITFGIWNTVEIEHDKNDTVTMKLFRQATYQHSVSEFQELAEKMRLGVEHHFSSDSAPHLSQRYAGTPPQGELDPSL